jgi:hypothetical protein
MSLEFSRMHLVVKDASPDVACLKKVCEQVENVFSLEDVTYLIKAQNIEDNFFWFYARYGKEFPYCEVVFDKGDEKEQPNPRLSSQIEPAYQLFAMYCMKDKVLYLSNLRKKIVVEKWLQEKLDASVTIKHFVKSAEDFIAVIKSVEKVRFVARRDLFSASNGVLDILPAPNDVYGLGMTEKFSLEAKFAKASVTENFKEIFKKMAIWKKNHVAESLICIGKDDKNIETIFNMDGFVQKVSLDITKDSNGRYSESDACDLLLKKLQERNAPSS